MKEVWICPTCTFENKGANMVCQMCDESKKAVKAQKIIPNPQKFDQQDKFFCNKGVQCTACSFINENYAMECQMCGENLMQQKPLNADMQQQGGKIQEKLEVEQKQQMIKCNSCAMENYSLNEKCVFCDNHLKEVLGMYEQEIQDVKLQCKFCGMMVRKNNVEIHEKDCQNSLKMIHGEIDDSKKIVCPYCWNKFYPRSITEHLKSCEQKQNIFKNKKIFGRLTALQLKTIRYMHEKCQSLHFNALDNLKAKVHKLGYSDEDLENLHHYIANYAPIIIHMRVSNHMQFFVKDTHYRNQFEVYKRDNPSRVAWQDRMFDSKHHSATFYERVKYGTINFTNDPKGVRACNGYGPSYFLLKQDVRDRCTLTDMDSASSTATIGTFRFCFHVLLKLNDKQLKGAFDGSKATQVNSEGVITSYKQIQIHGPVQFKEDIQRVYVNKSELNSQFQEMVQQFCDKNKVQYQTFQIKSGPYATGLFGKGLTLVKPAIKPTVFKKGPQKSSGHIKKKATKAKVYKY